MSRTATLLGIGLLSSVLWLGTPPLAALAQEKSSTVIAANSTTPAIGLGDLPSGFEPLPSELMQEMSAQLNSVEGLDVDEFFGYFQPDAFEMVLGLAVKMPNAEDRADFDATMQQPDFFLQQFMRGFQQGIGREGTVEESTIQILPAIGNSAVALSAKTSEVGSPCVRMDGVAFRREETAVFLFSLYLDGDVPLAPVANLSQRLDARLTQPSL
jgi:hypothetical protein